MSEIFNMLAGDAFSTASMIDPVNKTPYVPNFLEANMTFEEDRLTTGVAAVDEEGGQLTIIKTAKRGDQPERRAKDPKRKTRFFEVPSLPQSDRIMAIELDGLRQTGEAKLLMNLQTEMLSRFAAMRADMALTKEHHRLGCVQGVLADADGTVIYDWFDEFGIAKPESTSFKLSTASTDVPLICNGVVRKIQAAAKGRWTMNSRVVALCGDDFFDKFTRHSSVKETFLGWQQAQALRAGLGENGNASGAYSVFHFGGIDWVNYRGQEDYTASNAATKVGVPTGTARFFPTGVKGAFRKALAPHPSMSHINQPGQEDYPLILLDKEREMHVDLELYSYPLFMCALPEVLQTGTAA